MAESSLISIGDDALGVPEGWGLIRLAPGSPGILGKEVPKITGTGTATPLPVLV